jgi:hypothetical protein
MYFQIIFLKNKIGFICILLMKIDIIYIHIFHKLCWCIKYNLENFVSL